MKILIKQNLFFVLLLTYFFAGRIIASDTLKVKLDEITVTASRIPEAVRNAGKDVTIIDSSKLHNAIATELTDVLQEVEGLDLSRRGAAGIQADVGIRGGSFEQTAILIDGINFNNAQTGHHNLNVPLTLFDVRRIEILKGSGASLWGAGAFNGAINFIPITSGKNNLKLKILGGSFGLFSTLLGGNYSYGKFFTHFSFKKEKSDGYRFNTDFNFTKFNYFLNFTGKNISSRMYLGFFEKHFGANGFYSARFPQQKESVITRVLSSNTFFNWGFFRFDLQLNWLSVRDDFLLDYSKPAFYHNLHKTNQFGLKFQVIYSSYIGKTAIGFERNVDLINSNNLGNRRRIRGGFFLSHTEEFFNKLRLNFNVFAYYYSTEGWRFFPDFDINWNLGSNLNLFIAWGRAFRMPSFTELFYSDPVSQGDPLLKMEETSNLEAGLKFKKRSFFANLDFFNNAGRNIIDWARGKDELMWHSRNISSLNSFGVDIFVGFKLRQGLIKSFSLGYSLLRANRLTNNLISRYAFDYLKNQLTITLSHRFLFKSVFKWKLRYVDRLNGGSYFVTDFSFFRRIFPIEFFVIVENLFNKDYFDISGTKLPGRWIKAGITTNLY